MRLQVVLLSSCFLGLTINHSTFLCTKMNDPLATSVAGSLKNVIMTIIGSFAFGDFIYSSWNSLGLALSMVGALWYATKSAFKVSFSLKQLDCSCSRVLAQDI